MKLGRLLMTVIALGIFFSVGLSLSQAQGQGAMEAGPLSAPINDQFPVQGRLTDSAGNPLNGNLNVKLRVYDVAEGGVHLCENLFPINVTNGLFNSTLDLCGAAGAMTGEKLWLGVQVGSDPEMTPRQPINPVPFAYTVRPGAIIKGADSYVFVPGNTFVKRRDTDSTSWNLLESGAALISRGADPGDKTIYIPITLPSVLYGQNVTLEGVRIVYSCENGANNYINSTTLLRQYDTGAIDIIFNDLTNRQSDTITAYSVPVNLTLDNSHHILGLRLGLRFINNTDYVAIQGVKLTLRHQ